MTQLVFYGIDAIHLKEREELLPGRLIVIEGTDGVGRSTQLRLLRPWLESSGYAVVDTEMTRSVLVGAGLKQAKEGHTLGPITLNLFYATDFVDRFESQIVPALRAGFIVLTDRYIYSLMARALARGADPTWIRSIYGLALKPDAIFYLKIGIGELIPRVLQRGGFDFWESGMDMRLGEDLFESFVNYQTIMLAATWVSRYSDSSACASSTTYPAALRRSNNCSHCARSRVSSVSVSSRCMMGKRLEIRWCRTSITLMRISAMIASKRISSPGRSVRRV